MPGLKQTFAGKTQRTVSAGVLEAFGKGLLIATASFVAGTMLGTAHLAVGLWTIGLIAASGVGCMVGAALVNNMACNRWAKKSGWPPRAANVAKALPAVEAQQELAPEEYRARRRVMDERQRGGSGRRQAR
jgi:hypothetical protein